MLRGFGLTLMLVYFPTEAIGSIWPPADIKTFDPWDIPLIKHFDTFIIWNNRNMGAPSHDRG